MNFDKIDLTNGTQKFIALIMLGVVLCGLYFLLPPLVFIFQNLLLLIGMGLVICFLAFNYHNIWMLFKQISFQMTKKIISSNPLWYMYNYHTFILERISKLEKSITNITAVKVKLESKISELNKQMKSDASQVDRLQEKKKDDPNISENTIRVLANKVALTKSQLDSLLPQYVNVEKQEKYLQQLADYWTADAADLKNTLDAKADQYNMMKEVAEATGNASEFLKGNSKQYNDYQMSLKQIEDSCNLYTSNVQNFERKAKPILEGLAMNRELNIDDGLQLIEEFKKSKGSLLMLPEATEIVIK